MDCTIRKENINTLVLVVVWLLLVGVHKVNSEVAFDSAKSVGVIPDKVANKVQRDEELFLQGNSFYQQREYAQALSFYEAIKHKGRAVFYNRGNCYYYMQKPLEAFVGWCRARKGATYKEYDASVAACCALKEELSSGAYGGQLSGVGSTTQGKLCTGSFFERLYTPISLLALQILFGCLWYVFFLVLFFYKRVVRGRSRFKRSGLFLLYLLCILMSMFFMGFGVVTKYKKEWYPHAIVCVPQASLFAGPHKKYPVLRVLPCMEEVVVREKISGWCRLDINNTSGGWIEDTKIEIVE